MLQVVTRGISASSSNVRVEGEISCGIEISRDGRLLDLLHMDKMGALLNVATPVHRADTAIFDRAMRQV